MYLFNRSIAVNVQTDDYKTALVSGVFLDSHHEWCLNFSVDLETYEVTMAYGELRRAPHPDCLKVEERVKELVGLKLVHGVRKKIEAAVGKGMGCTHLTDLTLECVKGLVQARFNLMERQLPAEEMTNYVEDYLKGSCYHFREDSEIYGGKVKAHL